MLYRVFLLSLTIANLFSCEDSLPDPTGESIADKISGTWAVDESSTIFKSALQGYTVYISVLNYSSTISIKDFYGLGEKVEALGNIDEYQISLHSNQILSGGYTLISGLGVIDKSLKIINWTFYIDDGSGELDEVKAIYTFLY